VDGGASEDNVISFLRWGHAGEAPCLVVCNFSPVPRHNYRVGVPYKGHWQEVMNTDSSLYGGSDVGNYGGQDAKDIPWHIKPYSLELSLPPLGTIVFKHTK
jgi:1,4-alpha-glucan branching enzyme